MQNIFTNIKCSEIILFNANENWYIILYDLFSRLCYIATCGPFCKDATHLRIIFTQFETNGAAARRGTFRLAVNSQGKQPPAWLVIHPQTRHRAHVVKRCDVQTGPGIWSFSSLGYRPCDRSRPLSCTVFGHQAASARSDSNSLTRWTVW